MKKLSILTIIIISIFFPSLVIATTITRDKLQIDDAISDQSSRKYIEPTSIFITKISAPNNEYQYDYNKWISSLYYYSVTRLGYLDIPFTYVVDRDGKIYSMKSDGEVIDPQTESETGTVVIGYLSNNNDITSPAQISIKQLINDLSYKWGIEKKDVAIGDIQIVNQGNISKSRVTPVKGEFQNNVLSIVNQSTYFADQHIKYTAEIKDLSYSKSVKSGDTFTVTFGIVNKDTFPWFTENNPIYVSTYNFKDSQFAVNDKWESFSKPTAIKDKVVMPGEEIKISFDMKAMLLPGKYTQKFVVTKIPKNLFTNGNFQTEITVTKGEYDFVKVINISSLNVRECPGPSCKILSQVAQNQVLIKLDYQAGWYRVKYTDTKSGWVYGKYIQEL